MRPQICASRPSALRRNRARARAQAQMKIQGQGSRVKRRPRLAEVAGKARRNERSNDVGRDGIGKKQFSALSSHLSVTRSSLTAQRRELLPRPPKPGRNNRKEGFSQIWLDQNPLQSAQTIELCFIHEFGANCYEFLRYAALASLPLEMCRIKQSGSVRWIEDPLLEAGRMAKPNLPLTPSR